METKVWSPDSFRDISCEGHDLNLIWYSFARKNYLFLGNRKVRDTLANFSRERIYKREIG